LIDRRTLIAGLSAALVAPRRALAQTIKDAAGRTVPVPAKVSRVFPAGPPAAILLYTLAPELLIGWARANRPEECAYMLPDICTRPEVGRITGRGNTANLETVLALKPDLILDVGSTSATFVSLADRVQEQTSIPYALLDGRFTGIAGTYRTLGALIGRTEGAEKLARYAEDTLKTIEMLGRNVAGETQGGLANVSIEQVLVWNPDVIITIDQEFAATVRNDPSWTAVKAVRDNRVHLSPKMPFGWVDFPPSVNRLIGLWWLARILYPERFPEDLRALTADFYTRFYHVTPSSAQIDHVLAGRD
jgi:iron complex transport system substrate-binding protein